jgi:hypothetical protein
MKQKTLPAASAALLFTIVSGHGAVIYNESVNRDLSGLFGSPTPLNLTTGANTIIARMGNNGNFGATNGSDADYLTVTSDSGASLVSITVDSYSFGPNNPGVSFAGYVAAAEFAGQAAQDIGGSMLFNASSGNILDNFTGGPSPLGAGTYSFWFQETSSNLVDYQLTLNLVPEPSTTLLGIFGASLFLANRRRRH